MNLISLPLAGKLEPALLDERQVNEMYGLIVLSRIVRRFGQLRPVLVNKRTGRILDGYQLCSVCRSLGWQEVKAVEVDVPEEWEKLVAMALNNHVAEWCWKPLSLQLKSSSARGLDPAMSGFTLPDVEVLTAAGWDQPIEGEEKSLDQLELL
ncbi:MAG: hypothetical protein QXI19_14600 [Candidatus Caldarchaeum sp.]